MPARKTARGRASAKGRRRGRWSAEVTRHSGALDLESRAFTRSPREIAASLTRSAQRSRRRKAGPYQSAMSMLTFYINRAGRGLSAARRAKLERADRRGYERSKESAPELAAWDRVAAWPAE
jgi:Protein of unknown function (DUF3175)